MRSLLYVIIIPVHPLLTLALIMIAVYLGSCLIHPYRRCRSCNRSKESHSTLFKGAFGKCLSCRGVGHHIRWGARLLGRKN